LGNSRKECKCWRKIYDFDIDASQTPPNENEHEEIVEEKEINESDHGQDEEDIKFVILNFRKCKIFIMILMKLAIIKVLISHK